MSTDDAIMERLFNPPRPRLHECLAIVKPGMTGPEAWAALHAAGLIPDRWYESPTRRFVEAPDDNLRVTSGGSEPEQLAPPTPAACVALVSCGVEALDNAEELAVRARAQTVAWKSRLDTAPATASTWVWDIVAIGGLVPPRGPALLPGRAHFALSAAARAVEDKDRALFNATSAAIDEEDRRIAAVVTARTGMRRVPTLTATRWWSLACELDLRVPTEARRDDHGLGATPKSLRGKRFVELTDFVPTLRALALSGFGASTGFDGRCDMWALRPQFAALVAMNCA